jgi:hypothetical protein
MFDNFKYVSRSRKEALVYVNADALFRLAKQRQAEWLRWAARERSVAEVKRSRSSRRTLWLTRPPVESGRRETVEPAPSRQQAS